MFSQSQIDALSAPLSREHVATRQQSGRSLSYIEGWHAIAEANRIFGYAAWSRETLELRLVAERERPVGQGQGWGVSYVAKVRVSVIDMDGRAVERDGIGTGHGIDRDLGLAHESAAKEAETDAMKRALMTFGNPFGLALYDKTQANVAAAPRTVSNDTNPGQKDPGGADDLAAKWKTWAETEAGKIGLAEFDRAALAAWDASNRKYFAKCEKHAPGAYEVLQTTIEMRMAALDAIAA